MASNSKQYGLILPQKANQGLVRDRPSVFNDSSESEGETTGGATDWVKKALKRESERTFQKKQHQADMQKALAEDPTVYQYDEVYDKIEEKKAELSNAKKQLDKKPRYIQSLLQQAEKRKRENERRNERIIQKEREAEGDKFKDKESFVTSAYRQKLEEFKKLEEEERYQDAIEALTDVSKQKDLSGFYRHLYRQTVTGEQTVAAIKTEQDETTENIVENLPSTSEETTVKDIEEANVKSENILANASENSEDLDKKSTNRHYRKRRHSTASSDSQGEDASKSKTAQNLDADSDFSVDSDSSESESEESNKNNSEGNGKKSNSDKYTCTGSVKSTTNSKENEKIEISNSGKRSNNDDTNESAGKKVREGKADENKDVSHDAKPLDSEKKIVVPKLNIWIKRTVGEAFDNALQRYYQRKAEKSSSKG